MRKKMSKANLILALSLLGMSSVLITIVSDFILIGKPSSAYDFLLTGTESMWDIAPWRITLGAFIGVYVLPFQILGLVPMYFALKPSGRVLPVMAAIINAHTLLMGVAFHISYAFIGSGWRMYLFNEMKNDMTTAMIDKFDFYWMILAVIMVLELVVGSGIYAWIVLKGKSLYPKWMAIFNHFFLVLFTCLVIFLIPAPLGGYLAPAVLNIATMTYFIILIAVGYKKWKQQEEHEIMKDMM